MKKKKPIYKRWWFITLAVLVLLFLAIPTDEDTPTEGDLSQSSDTEEDNEVGKQEPPEFEATLDASVKDGNKIEAVVKTNAPDGSIINIIMVDGEFNIDSQLVEVTDGKAIAEFDAGEKPRYLSFTAVFAFNNEEYQQPKNVVEYYGEKGEKLRGPLVQQFGEYKSASIKDPVTIAYPDEETVQRYQVELLLQAFDTYIEEADGAILSIEPLRYDGKIDWKIYHVTLSDGWYYLKTFEKERVVDSIVSVIKQLAVNAGLVKEDDIVQVYFCDRFNKELAKPKLLGGYKIIR